MIGLRVQLLTMLFAASAAAAVHASVFSVLGYNDKALPTGEVGGESKRVAVNVSVRKVPTESTMLVEKLTQPANNFVKPELEKKETKKLHQASVDKNHTSQQKNKKKAATSKTVSNVKLEPIEPVESNAISESPLTTEPEPVVQPKSQAQTSSESPTLKEGLTKQENMVSEAYKLALVKRLAEKKHYPIKARLAGIEGTADARFSVAANGHLLDFELVSSSGSAYLDKAVQKTFDKAFPLPRFITELGTGQIQTFTLPIHFKIK